MPAPSPARVAAVLSKRWGGPIDIVDVNRIEPWSVARFGIRGGPNDAVIVKWVRPGDPTDPGARADPRQVLTEATALEFLADCDVNTVPQLIAVDPDRTFLILAEIIDWHPLDQVIKRHGYDDRARCRLRDFAETLGRQHAMTAGRADQFRCRLSQATGVDADVPRHLGRDLAWTIKATEPLGCPHPSAAAWDEAAEISRRLAQPGSLHALSNGDVGTNNFLVDSIGGTLIDFEFAGYRHCLLDLIEFYLPGPRWVTVDDPVRLGLEEHYRAIAGAAIPDLIDDDRFDTDLVAAGLTWARLRVHNFPRIDARPAGDTSRLQRLVTIETALISRSGRC